MPLAAGFNAPLAEADPLSPFRSPNLNPPSAIIALPLWSEVAERRSFGISTEVANHYRLKERAGDRLILDGETVRLRAYLEQPLGDSWSLGIDIPYIHHSGGILDDVVDGWHSTFRLPDGSRNHRPEGLLEFELGNGGGSFFELEQSQGGLGDVQLSAARRFGGANGWHLRATLKLPTGRESLLAGSGSTDWMLSALRVVRADFRGRAASFFFGGGAVAIEQPKRVQFPTEDSALVAVFGGALTLGRRAGIKGQVDVNSALYVSQLEELGQTAVQATLGGFRRIGDGGLFEFALSEDLHVSTTPDVVIHFNLRWELQ